MTNFIRTTFFITFILTSINIKAQLTFCFPDPARCYPDSCFGCYEVKFTTPNPAALPNDLIQGDSILLTFETTHPRIGELNLQLISPSGNSIAVFDQPGAPPGTTGCTNAGMKARFYATAPLNYSMLESTCNTASPPTSYAIQGDYKPLQPFSFFNGDGITGTWTLQVCDINPANNPTSFAINRPCLTFLNKQKPPCNNATFEALPICAADGSFQIQVRITQAGDANPNGFDINGDGNVDLPEATGATVTIGPFPSGSTQHLTIVGMNNANCSQEFTVRCPCTPPTFAAVPLCSGNGSLTLTLQVTGAGIGNPSGFTIGYRNALSGGQVISTNQSIGQNLNDAVTLGVDFPDNLLVDLVLVGIDDPTCIINLNGIKCIDPNAIPTMGEWGLLSLFLSLLSLGMLFLDFQVLPFASANAVVLNKNRFFYFNKQIFISSVLLSLGFALLCVPFILYIWGTFTITDFFGLGITTLLLAYFIHLLRRY